ncbi:MAG: divalent cation tolerance protein CutA, partial [Bacteroidota bacterium]
MSLRTLYITCRDLEEAQSIAKTVVKERLAACGNILPGMQSVYHWEGKVVEDSEVVLL